MFRTIVVPVDGSAPARRALDFGAAIAAETAAELEVVTVVGDVRDRDAALGELTLIAGELAAQPRCTVLVADADGGVAPAIAAHVEATPGAMLVMSTHGRGRSAAVLGSVADELLELTFGPLIAVGPRASRPRPLGGRVVIPTDGSELADLAIPLGGAWGIALGATPWLVHALAPSAPDPGTWDLEQSSVMHRARELSRSTGRPVEYEVLHAGDPAWAIVDFADSVDASLIVMSTHGRSGVRRLALGSVASDVVRRAHCPVVLHRPPRLPNGK